MSERRRPVVVAVVLVLGLALSAAACGKNKAPQAVGLTNDGGGGATSTTGPGGGGPGPTTTAKGDTATTSRHGPSTTATTGTTRTTTTVAGGGLGPATPAAPGRYAYRQQGSSTTGGQTTPVPSEGTLVVDAADGGGNQVDHRAVNPKNPPDDTRFAFANGGMAVTQVVIRATVSGQTLAFTCTFNPGVPAPPWPPAAGKAISGHGDCGNFTADVSGQVDSSRQATLDGTSRQVWVVKTTMTLSGQVTGTITETDWFDPSLRLSVHVERQADLHYGFSSFQESLTADLESGRPS